MEENQGQEKETLPDEPQEAGLVVAICRIIKVKTGHDFSSYKASAVMRRIERRMAVNDVGSTEGYIDFLEKNPQEAQAICRDILIGVTSFFRDPDAFETLRREIIPRLFADRDPDEPVRIWHACCASGEEVYSMAILIQEYLSEIKRSARVQFFATDIDEVAIAQARAGLYSDATVADLSQERLRTFFTRTNGHWQVSKQLREMIVFAHHSLIKDAPFSRLDLLVCRNFLIYLNPDMQKRLIAMFHQVLRPGCFLFLGSAESAGLNSDLFEPVDKKWKIFERREGQRSPDSIFPFTTQVRFPGISCPVRPAEPEEPNPGLLAEKLIMERYSPPFVVVNEKYEVVHFSVRTSGLLEVPQGKPTRDLLKMAREELRPVLRAAICKAFGEQKQVVFQRVRVSPGDAERTINVLVEPVSTSPQSGKLAMVIFEPATDAAAAAMAPGKNEEPLDDVTSRDILNRQLEEQLRITHEQLQATAEQLETSNEGFMSATEELMSINEEFQSANEELQSTNEELETSKEELQALNMELVTVNAELQGKVEELNRANSDMENLFNSAATATLFLEHRLNIKGFTPAMAEIFNLIPADVGRPFRHLSGNIDWPTLAQDVETVLDGLPFTEREVATLDGERCFLMRIFPYRTQAGMIDGIVVNLVDITGLKQTEERLQGLLQEKEVLMNEIHHRVKNNMQIISSLVNHQADTIDDPGLRGCFNGLRGQVRSMALVHEKLYQSRNLARLEFDEYTRSLMSYLWRSHGISTADVRLTQDLEPLSLPVDSAIPCGLILNELISNALRHAFREGRGGEVTISLHNGPDGRVNLRVRDNGIGLPPDLDWRQSRSLGLQLVQMLADQLKARVEVDRDGGTEFRISFTAPDTEKGESKHE